MNRILSKHRREFVLLLVTVASFGCSRESHPSSFGIVRFASTPQPLATAALIASSKGLWPSAAGSHVDVTEFLSGRLILDAVLGGSADIGMAAETPLALAAAAGRPLVILATLTQTNQCVWILGRTDRGVTSPQGLRGRSVAIYEDTLSEYYMDQTLRGVGMNRSDLKQINTLSPPQMINALAQDHVDAAFIWQPTVAIVKQQMGAAVTIFPGPEPSTGTFNLFTTREYLQKHPDGALAILRGLKSATTFVNSNREASIGLIAPKLGLDPAIVRTFFDEFTYRLSLDNKLLDVLVQQAQWLSSRGQMQGGKDAAFFRGCVDPEPLRQISPDAVTLR
jgi:NitT/TauT family transport system substrate-binding protein